MSNKDESDTSTLGLRRLVTKAVDEALEAGRVVARSWLAHQIVQDLGEVKGEHADLYTAALYFSLGRFIEIRIREIKGVEKEQDVDVQMVLPGYKRLQRRYALKRGGDLVAVPIELMSIEELTAKEREHRAMARGHVQHADELLDYIGSQKLAN